ncbi:hypothetical protein RRG08_031818 [Elysia crispata]|uniref:Uncharacterized protein n=1 Tax=Elysia crispata TaxID=231223 RepID=A0AAE0Y5M0_9GAST|nr:hypothetical protein RRG08_031818 [Elysia crispata]
MADLTSVKSRTASSAFCPVCQARSKLINGKFIRAAIWKPDGYWGDINCLNLLSFVGRITFPLCFASLSPFTFADQGATRAISGDLHKLRDRITATSGERNGGKRISIDLSFLI